MQNHVPTKSTFDESELLGVLLLVDSTLEPQPTRKHADRNRETTTIRVLVLHNAHIALTLVV